MKNIELFNDHFQNFKVYGIPHAQLIIADGIMRENIGKCCNHADGYLSAGGLRRGCGIAARFFFFLNTNYTN